MLDFPLMLLVKLPVVDRIHPQSDTFATGVVTQNLMTALVKVQYQHVVTILTEAD